MGAIDLPDRFIVFDLEWTAWEGSRERKWSGPDEYREIYDIGAVKVSGSAYNIEDQFRQLVTLELVPTLPEYSTNLTGITQQEIERSGIPYNQAIASFSSFCEDLSLYSWGPDDKVVFENCELKRINCPIEHSRFNDMRDVFKARGIPADDYYSSTIVEYFGQQNKHTAHQAVDDALNIVEALRLLHNKP